VTSPIAQRLAGQGIASTNRPIKSATSVDTPLRASVLVFICAKEAGGLAENLISASKHCADFEEIPLLACGQNPQRSFNAPRNAL
jgi:hypothetical protein